MGQLALVIFNGVCVLLNISPLYYQLAQGNANSSAISMSLWIMISSLSNFINLIAFYDNVDVERLPGWCDINVKITVAGVVGRAAASMCLACFLSSVVSPCATTITRRDRRNRYLFDYFLCFVIPLAVMGCHVLYQPSRFGLRPNAGCVTTFWASWPLLILNLIWAPLFSVAGVLYSTYVAFRLAKHRRDFSRAIAGSHSAITTGRFIRLTAFAAIYLIIGVPLSIYLAYASILLSGAYADYSYKYIHSWWDATPIYPKPDARELVSYWSDVIVAFCHFLCFGLGGESGALYVKFFQISGLNGLWTRLSTKVTSSERAGSWPRHRKSANPYSASHSDEAYGGAFHLNYSESRSGGGVKVVVEREDNFA
ncbi:mating pheromone receptor a2 [Meredithblackwellia eburnea MCA 4105]